jgi:hypothetical protein
MGASEVLYSKSGRFVTNDGSGRMEVSSASSTAISGWIEEAAPDGLTCSSAEGATVLNMFNSLDDVFRMPLAYDASTYDRNYSYDLDQETCDLVLINGIQYADLSASADDLIRIVGGKAATAAFTDGSVTGLCLGDGYVDVQLVEGKLYATGVE